jgi:hypothetical protein
MKNHADMDNNPYFKLVVFPQVCVFNMLQERINPRCACLWFGMNLPNHHFNDGTKKEMSAIKGSTIEVLTHKNWTNNSTGCKQHQRQPSIELSQDSS